MQTDLRVTRKRMVVEDKKYLWPRKIFIELAVLVLLWFLFTICILSLALRQVNSSSGHSDKELHRYQRSSFNASIFDNLPFEYCHPPEKPVVGLEGFVPSGYDLQQVHIFISVGETSSPLSLDKTHQPNVVSCPHSDCKLREIHRQHHTLKFFEEKVYQDYRFKKHFSANIFDDQSCTNELTPFGIQKLVMLGEFLQDVYLKDLNLESSRIQPKHIKAFNNGQEMTMKSSLAFLFGFLPENHLNQIQIEKTYTSLCSEKSKSANMKCDCPLLFSEEKKIREQLLSNISSEILIPGTTTILNHGLSSVCSNPTLSCFAKNLEHVRKFVHEFDVFYQGLLLNNSYVDFINTFLYPVFQDLVGNFRQADHIFEKLFLHSVEDHMLFYMLNVLKTPLRTWPKPGARLVFELYKKKGQKFQPFYVRIIYNGANVIHFLPLCQINMESGLCRLKNFMYLLRYKTSHNNDLKTAYWRYCGRSF